MSLRMDTDAHAEGTGESAPADPIYRPNACVDCGDECEPNRARCAACRAGVAAGSLADRDYDEERDMPAADAAEEE